MLSKPAGFLIILITCISISSTASIRCKLKGSLVDRTSKAVLLIKANNDMRGGSTRIPVIDNHFEYILETEEMEAYQLVVEEEYLDGAWVPTLFFPDSTQIDFTLYPREIAYEKNSVQGGMLNKEYAEFKIQMITRFDPAFAEISSKQKELRNKKDYYSPAYDSIMSRLMRNRDSDIKRILFLEREELHKTGADLTANGRVVYAEQMAMLDQRNDWRYDYIQKHISLVSYFLMLQDMNYRAGEDEKIAKHVFATYHLFTEAFPTHGYTKRIKNEVAGLNLRKAGQSFVDFTAPDLAGKKYTFSALLNNKVTLLDLWGSWCGPCMAASRSMLPVYKDFKDKGFQVISVAREFHKLDDLKIALKREKYPWLNLVELDDKNEIWSKYNINNAGGAIFLFDKDGKILAVNPTAEELRKILPGKL